MKDLGDLVNVDTHPIVQRLCATDSRWRAAWNRDLSQFQGDAGQAFQYLIQRLGEFKRRLHHFGGWKWKSHYLRARTDDVNLTFACWLVERRWEALRREGLAGRKGETK